jgi:P27 family predicted phage terminase small subunit
MKGRRPKPTRLRVIEGNRGKRPVNQAEAKPAATVPRPPRHFSKRGRELAQEGQQLALEATREYHRVSRQLSKLGLLTDIDGALLALYCDAYARWVVASRGLQKHGLLVKAGRSDRGPVKSPYATLVDHAFDRMVKIATEFGMSPSSRSRIQGAPAASNDPEEAFFLRIKG